MDCQHPCIFIQTTTNVHHDKKTRRHRIKRTLLYHSTCILHPLHRTWIHHTRRRTRIRHDHTTDAKHCHHISIYLYRTQRQRR